jgi:UDP-3-O-[3-hydroxymyristoyl] glucosamine N-acyltransferase
MNSYSLKAIQEIIPDSEILNISNPESLLIHSITHLSKSNKTSISFLAAKQYVKQAKESNAGALIVSKEFADQIPNIPLIVVKNAEMAGITVLNLFHPPRQPDGIISKLASVHPSAVIGENTTIGDFVVVSAGASIGKNSIIEPGVFIGEGVSIGDEARLGANSVFHHGAIIGHRFVCFGNCTIGSDGFKFSHYNSRFHKVPQISTVVIGDDVEFGSGCCVDRGGMSDTMIGNGCKFDNMVHIAHNCELGENVIIAGQTGIAGSTKIGNNVWMSGHCAIQDHIEIADGTKLGGVTGIRHSIKEPNGGFVGELGLPFMDFQKVRANIKHLINFQKWIKRIETLEEKLGMTTQQKP